MDSHTLVYTREEYPRNYYIHSTWYQCSCGKGYRDYDQFKEHTKENKMITVEQIKQKTGELILSFRTLALIAETDEEADNCDFACSILEEVLGWMEK